MGHSFRLRLALSSALLAGMALAGFAATAWWQVRDAKIDALDRAIRDQAERELSRPWPAEHWAPHEQHMGRVLGTQTLQQSLLLVQEGEAVIYRSEHWPVGLDAEALPWPHPEPRSYILILIFLS